MNMKNEANTPGEDIVVAHGQERSPDYRVASIYWHAQCKLIEADSAAKAKKIEALSNLVVEAYDEATPFLGLAIPFARSYVKRKLEALLAC